MHISPYAPPSFQRRQDPRDTQSGIFKGLAMCVEGGRLQVGWTEEIQTSQELRAAYSVFLIYINTLTGHIFLFVYP